MKQMKFHAFAQLVAVLILAHTDAASAAGCLSAPANLAEQGMLTIGITTGVPPMSYVESYTEGSAPTGFDVQLGEALAKEMCLKPNLINMPFTGLLPAVNARKLDVIVASAGITPARQAVFEMTPYFVGGVRLVALKKSNIHFRDEYDACGHSVSTRAGSVEAHALEVARAKCPANNPMNLSVFASDNEALQQLYKGVVDASFLDWPVAAYTAAKDERVVPASPILSGDGPGTPRHIDGLMMRKDDASLATAMNAALKQAMDDGTYDKLLTQYKLTEGDVRKVRH